MVLAFSKLYSGGTRQVKIYGVQGGKQGLKLKSTKSGELEKSLDADFRP